MADLGGSFGEPPMADLGVSSPPMTDLWVSSPPMADLGNSPPPSPPQSPQPSTPPPTKQRRSGKAKVPDDDNDNAEKAPVNRELFPTSTPAKKPKNRMHIRKMKRDNTESEESGAEPFYVPTFSCCWERKEKDNFIECLTVLSHQLTHSVRGGITFRVKGGLG